MDYRRLIKFGNSSFVVSVPKDWLKKNNLEKGDMIYMNENGNNELVLTSKMEEGEHESLAFTLNIDSLSYQSIERRIISKYIAGYDVFILQGEKLLQQQEHLRKLLNSLMALEIVEQNKTKIIAKDFLNPAEISFKTMIRRIDTILRSMFEDTKTVSDEKDSFELVKRDEDINRLSYLVLRTIRKCISYPQLAKKMDASMEALFFYREMIECLERIADELKRISRSLTLSKSSAKHLNNFHLLFDEIYKVYLETLKAHYNQDENLAYELSEQREVLLVKCVTIIQNIQDHHLLLSIERLKTVVTLIRNIQRIIYRG